MYFQSNHVNIIVYLQSDHDSGITPSNILQSFRMWLSNLETMSEELEFCRGGKELEHEYQIDSLAYKAIRP